MSRALVLAIVLAACGSNKTAPDAVAICTGAATPKGVIVLRTDDPAGGGKARGLRELATRSGTKNADVIAELDRFMSAADALAILTAHAEERERKLREDLEIVRAIATTIQEAVLRDQATPQVAAPGQPPRPAPSDWPFPAALRFPALIGARAATEDLGLEVAELTKPLADGSALAAVNERATALATTLRDLAATLAAPGAAVLEGIKVSNVAHGKLNETAATLTTIGASLGALADEHDGRRYAEAVRLWTRLSVAAARLSDPWPERVPTAHAKALVIAGPRQQVVTCDVTKSFSPSPAIAAALPSIKLVRDGIGRSLGWPGGPADAPSLNALRTAIDAALTN